MFNHAEYALKESADPNCPHCDGRGVVCYGVSRDEYGRPDELEAPPEVCRCTFGKSEKMLIVEVARLRAERDAARAEVERLRGKLDFAQKSIPFDFVVGAGQLVQERDAAREAAATWKRAAKHWRRIGIDHIGAHFARWLFRVRKEPRR